MSQQQFFEDPILNLPSERPVRHRELGKSGQPTNIIITQRRRSDRVSPIPPSKKSTGKSEEVSLFSDGDDRERYNPIELINGIRPTVESWRELPQSQWQVSPSYYRSREFVPDDVLCDLGKAKIVITNYHGFKRRAEVPPDKGQQAALQTEETSESDGASV